MIPVLSNLGLGKTACNPSKTTTVVMGHEILVGVSKNRGTPKWMVYSGKPY